MNCARELMLLPCPNLCRQLCSQDSVEKNVVTRASMQANGTVGDDDACGVLLNGLKSVHTQIDDLKRQYCSLFEWADGPLVTSMKCGDLLLLDEISLAEDSVLERLNSVFEPGRKVLLAEKGGTPPEIVQGTDLWRVMATMNPGGDFGKRELSPALRNRFSEVWVPELRFDDARLIVDSA